MIFRFYCTFILVFVSIEYTTGKKVSYSQGTVEGALLSSRNGTSYYAFLGLPFAKPPIDNLRFEPPQPADSWKGVRNATMVPPWCLQLLLARNDAVIGSEDCLYLSVYTPVKRNKLLPVIIGIHGGAFHALGGGMYDPRYLMDHDIVFVSIQYRLHALGFLSTGDHVLPGNNGMKDQVMALKWVQKNIAAFGGDPKKVTLLGDSAGGASVHYHMYSPLSKGLFSAGISMSGTAFSSWAFIPSLIARQRAVALGVLARCPTENSQMLKNCLKKVPSRILAESRSKMQMWNHVTDVTFPITDEPTDLNDTFLTNYQNPWCHEKPSQIPWLLGIVSREGLVLVSDFLKTRERYAADLDQHYKYFFPIFLQYDMMASSERSDKETESLRKFYFGNKNITGAAITENLAEIIGDAQFNYDTMRAAREHRLHGITYFYNYDHKNRKSTADLFGLHFKDIKVPTHGDQLLSIFDLSTSIMPDYISEGDDLKVSERFIKYLINFAHNRNPKDENRQVWTPVKSNSLEYLHVTTEADKMERNLLEERYSLWDNLDVGQKKYRNSCRISKDEL